MMPGCKLQKLWIGCGMIENKDNTMPNSGQ